VFEKFTHKVQHKLLLAVDETIRVGGVCLIIGSITRVGNRKWAKRSDLLIQM